MTTLFTREYAWAAGYYELTLVLAGSADVTLRAAQAALWSHPSLHGCYLDPSIEPEDQERYLVGDPRLDLHTPLHGIAELSSELMAPCMTGVVRVDQKPDWIWLGIPRGSLEKLFFDPPFEETELIDRIFLEVADQVHRASPIRIGFIATEESLAQYVDQFDRGGVPKERRVGFLVPSGEGLQYFPATVRFGRD